MAVRPCPESLQRNTRATSRPRDLPTMDDDDLFSMLPSSSKAPAAAKSSSRTDSRKKRPAATDSEEDVARRSEPHRKQRRSEGQDDVHANDSGADEDPMAALDRGNATMDADQSMEDEAVAQPAPVVTDDFEQEAEREVAASKGFAATDEGEKMKLVHQVRHQVSYSGRNLSRSKRLLTRFRSAGRTATRLSLRPHFDSCSKGSASAHVQIHPRSFPARGRQLDRAKRIGPRIGSYVGG